MLIHQEKLQVESESSLLVITHKLVYISNITPSHFSFQSKHSTRHIAWNFLHWEDFSVPLSFRDAPEWRSVKSQLSALQWRLHIVQDHRRSGLGFSFLYQLITGRSP